MFYLKICQIKLRENYLTFNGVFVVNIAGLDKVYNLFCINVCKLQNIHVMPQKLLHNNRLINLNILHKHCIYDVLK